MRLAGFRYLADENFDPDVISHLARLGWDVVSSSDRGLRGADDLSVLRSAVADGRVLLTHDGDFGAHVMLDREPLIGIVFLRPGHVQAAFTIGTIDALVAQEPDIEPPFILVARRRGPDVRVRIRRV